MTEVQAVLTDIDNTFLYEQDGHDVIPDTHIQAVQTAEGMGMPVLPVTGRSLALMQSVDEAVGFQHSGVLDCGASVYDFRGVVNILQSAGSPQRPFSK